MRRLAFFLALWTSAPSFAWNPLEDLRTETIWTFGKKAEVGEAFKLAGSGDLKTGETTTSVLAGIADYRFLSLSYGGTRINQSNKDFTDTLKVGFRLNSFLDWFQNPLTPEMAFLRNVNIGPSFAMSVFGSPRVGTLFLDINYSFGEKAANP
jgi:hypothetical protein